MDNFFTHFNGDSELSYLLLYNGILTIIRGVIVVAKSKAKKAREKLTREGRMNPEEKRSPFVFADMRPRTTKTKKDHLYQIKYKNHQSQTGNDGSFYFAASANRLINDRLLKYKLCASSRDTSVNLILVSGTA
jgi:hypothetical protein